MAYSSAMDDGASAFNETVVNIDLDEDNYDLDLTNYEEQEINHINEVLQKDKSLRCEERDRKKKIENNLDQSIMSIEMKNVDSGENFCVVCSEKFKFLVNPRKVCVICEKGVCSTCLYKLYANNILICKLCFLISTREGKTGKWFNSLSKNNGRFRRSANSVIMQSIRKIKSRFSTNSVSENHQPQILEPIKDIVNGLLHNPIYKPHNKFKLEKEAIKLGKQIAHDVVDSREMEVIANGHVAAEVKHLTNEIQRNDFLDPHVGHHSNLRNMSSLSSSLMSVYSETHESYNAGIPVSGDVSFSVYYDNNSKMLMIYVEQCRNISVADRRKGRTDPYIKTYLLPDRTKMSKKKTSIKNMTVNPVFKETLAYYIDQNDIASRTLSLAVWHQSSLLKFNIFLGEVQIVLSDADLSNKECSWFPFHEKRKYPLRSAGFIFKGEIMMKLKYKASARKDGKGTLHVHIVGAKNLQTDRATLNSYVKGYLLPRKDVKSKQKTSVCKLNLNPTWNSLLQFPEVSLDDLKDRSLELSIYHHNKLKVNEFLGGVRLNLGLGLHSSEHVQWMDAQGAEKEAWEQFLANPNEYSDVTLNLRPNLDF